MDPYEPDTLPADNPHTVNITCNGTVTAYFTVPAITGAVWNDLDKDGIQDGGGETGRSGLAVKLRKVSDDSLAGETNTDANGAFSFTGKAAADYYIVFPETVGWLFSPMDQGGNDATDSDADPATTRTANFTWNASGNLDRDCGTYQFPGNVSAATAKTMTETIDGLVVIDVRDNSSYCAGHAPCAVNRPWASGSLNFTGLTKAAKTLVVGVDGIDSTRASAYLVENGFTDVSNMTAPWSSWTGTSVACADTYPVADPGPDRVITEDTLITLNGSGSTQAAIKSYLWEQVSGPVVAINNANTLSPSFVTPRVDAPTNLVFRLTVTAMCGSVEHKDVTVTVTDTGFTAHAKGIVWNDLDKDGVQDEGEPGLSGVTVTLYRSGTGDYANETTTDLNGLWEMSVPVSGNYYVVFGRPANILFSPMDQGGNDALDSDANPDTGQSADLAFTVDGTDLDIDAGTWLFESVFTPAEALSATSARPVPVVIDIRDNPAYCGGHIYCAFNLTWPEALKAGMGGIGLDYDILIVDADGSLAAMAAAWLKSQGFTDVTIMSGGMAAWTGGTQACAEVWPAAAAGGFITVTEGAPVNLSGAGSSTQGIHSTSWTQTSGPAVTLTGADGLTPSFTAPLVTGNQTLTFRLFIEAACGPTAQDTATVIVYDVGFSGRVAGKAWNDLDTDGVQDGGGETGLAGVTVKLYEASNNNLTGSATTAADGSYNFNVTKDVDWYVKFTPPAGYVFSLQNQGGDETDSDADRGTGVTDSANIPADGGSVALDAGLSLYPNNVDIAGAKNLIDAKPNLVVIDVREADTEFCAAGGHIHCAVNYPLTSGYLAAHYAELDPNAETLVICAVGGRSTQALNFLLSKGFTNLYNTVPGMNAWISGGYPVTTCGAPFPVAAAGDDQSVNEAAQVTLNGSLSSTAGFSAYTWTQKAGPAVGLSNIHAQSPTFTAPLVNGATDLVFEIKVSAKCGADAMDEVKVTVNDLGFTVAASGFVWNDPDHDGYQDPEETGIDNVTVKLYDASTDAVAAQAATAGGGFYQMAVPSPGNYYARFTPPAGYMFTPKDINVDDLDSDADPALGKTDTAALSTDGVNQDWDCGMYAFSGNVSPAQALDLLKTRPNLVIVDVRENATEFCAAGGHIYCAVNFPWTSGYLIANYGELDPTAETLVTCAVGGRSTQAVNFLAAHGFTNLYNMVPGMNDWITAAYPVAVCGQPFPVSDAGIDSVMEEGRTVTIGGPNTSRMDDFFQYEWTQTAGPVVALSNASAITATFVAPKVSMPTSVVFSLRTYTDRCESATTDTVTVTVGDNGLNEANYPGADVTFKTWDGSGGLGIDAELGELVALAAVDPASIAATAGRPETFPFGLVSLGMRTTVGGTARFVIILPSAAPANASWYKYGRAGWKNLAATGAAVFDATRTRVTISIVDGGADDADGLANGMVLDPSGLGTVTAPAPDQDKPKTDAGGGGGCFVEALPKIGARCMGRAALSLVVLALILFLAIPSKRR
ncbi:MAG: hypothetical protein HZB23_00375 [Deltaproteobacteria bacterium]|nr:hypothetical protein [Deltaproteobacteria bacterium]